MITGSCFVKRVFPLFFLFAFISCRHKSTDANSNNIERGVYYWKSSESVFDSTETAAVKKLDIKKMYVKFFEVEFDQIYGVRPVSKTSINFRYADNAAVKNQVTVVPVVFIKNEALTNTQKEDIEKLADNINFLVKKKYVEHIGYISDLVIKELQIDCDWTATTKDKYFTLLKVLKQISGSQISCTLRMYPYKYPEIMGVPPVDKVTLMCYNLNNPLEYENKNSILEIAELKEYLDTKKPYPVHLDIVLPINSWMLLFKNNQFAGILHDEDIIKDIAKPIKPMWYVATRDTLVDEVLIREGDMIKYEETGKEQLKEVAGLLKAKLNLKGKTTISFFHLDKSTLNKNSNETLSFLYNAFN